MERRVNCFNFIFSKCYNESKCPYGHVIVNNKDEYLYKLNQDLDGVRENTSPVDTQPRFNTVLDDSLIRSAEMALVNCRVCNSYKLERQSSSNEIFICRECQIGRMGQDLSQSGFLIQRNIFTM